MTKRVVCINADVMDDEAELMIAALIDTANPGLAALAEAIRAAMIAEPNYMVKMDRNWETPKVRHLRDTCDVEGCEEACDPDDLNNFCSRHADEWENSTGYFAIESSGQKV